MYAFTLDQIQLLLAVVDAGSFSGAARTLNRAQSAVTYGFQKLEAQIGVELFDRAAYRPVLTPAGQALLLRGRRIAEETRAFGDQARGLSGGLEPEVSIVLDSTFPVDAIVGALRAFTARFPTVPPRIFVQPLGGAAELLLDGTCMIGLLPLMFCDIALLKLFPLLTIDLVPVVAAGHALAMFDGVIGSDALQQHVQLVLSDRSDMTAGRDFGVLSARTWRLADLGVKQAMLRAGLGWGSMPAHMVADDIAQGRLVVIRPQGFEPGTSRVVLGGAYLAEGRLGPAAQWMVRHLSEGADHPLRA